MSVPVSLVTGGTGGLGRAVVAHLLGRGEVVVVPWVAERELPRLREYLHDHGVPEAGLRLVEADVATEEGISAISEAIGAAGTLRTAALLVGGFAMGSVEETGDEVWERLVQMNLGTLWRSARAVVPLLREGGGGSIVTVASPAGLGAGSKGMAAYGATKSAVVSLTRTLAEEAGGDGIRVNAIAPDIIDTPGNRAAMPDADRSAWLAPEEIARVVGFLSGPDGEVVRGAVLTLTRS